MKNMKNHQSSSLPIFEQIKEIDENGNEFWGARKLSKALEYTDFRNFLVVVEKAKVACKNSGQQIENHFVDFNEMVTIGSSANRTISSIKLSRYACYLIVQNADPSKEVVALGQTYFAVQTRLQEIRQMEGIFLRKELSNRPSYLALYPINSGVKILAITTIFTPAK